MGWSDAESVEPERRNPGREKARPFLNLVLQADQPLAPGMRWSLDGLERVELSRGTRRHGEQEGRKLWLQLGDRSISSNHAQLHRVGTRWRVRDLESKNGTWLNGQRIQGASLADGDLLQVGPT